MYKMNYNQTIEFTKDAKGRWNLLKVSGCTYQGLRQFIHLEGVEVAMRRAGLRRHLQTNNLLVYCKVD